MIALNATKLAASIKSLRQVRTRVATEADRIYAQKIYYLYDLAVRVSPQYSGDFASNWNIVVDGDMPVYKQWAAKVTGSVVPTHNPNGTTSYRVHQAGDLEAVTTSLNRGASQLRGVTIKSRVHLVNATELAVDSTGHMMTSPYGTERLRPENVIPTATSIEAFVRSHAIHTPTLKPSSL